MAAQASYIARYMGGEHEQVWAELHALGAAVREGALYTEALAVAHETMRRVRHNLELLLPRLQAIGYSFGDDAWEWAQARLLGDEESYLAHRRPPDLVTAPPSLDVTEQLAELETLRGHAPISVMAWYQVVGTVNFTGLAPESWWQMRTESDPARDEERDLRDEQLVERRDHTYWLDPIYLWPLDQAIRSARLYDALLRGELGGNISAWRDRYIPVIPMGPDMHSKYHYSGGGPVGVRAPEPAMDGLFANDRYQGLFVDYLRLCCQHAGLPGLRDLPRLMREQGVPAQVEQIERDLRYLTEGLLPF